MSQFVTQIRPQGITEQRLDLKGQVFPEYRFRFWQAHQRAQAVFVLNAINVEIGGFHPSILQVEPNHVLYLGR